jgi:hypothetical protein
MRIVENSVQRLALRDQTIWITALCSAAAAFILYQLFVNQEFGSQASIALLFAIFGLIGLRVSNVEFDKMAQLCILSKLSMFKRTRLTIHFADIVDVKIDIEPMNTDSQQESCRLCLATASGAIPLSETYEPGLRHYNEIRIAILEALGNQEALAASQPDPVQSLVQQGRTIDAVALLRQRENLDLATTRKRIDEMQKSENRD